MKLCLSALILYALSDDSSRISLHQVTSNFRPISGAIFACVLVYIYRILLCLFIFISIFSVMLILSRRV